LTRGAVYSYFDLNSNNFTKYTEEQWKAMAKDRVIPAPEWIQPSIIPANPVSIKNQFRPTCR